MVNISKYRDDGNGRYWSGTAEEEAAYLQEAGKTEIIVRLNILDSKVPRGLEDDIRADVSTRFYRLPQFTQDIIIEKETLRAKLLELL